MSVDGHRQHGRGKPGLIDYVEEAQDIFAEMDESFAAIDRILESPVPDLIELGKFATALRYETTYFIQAVRRAIEQAEGGEQ